MTNLLSLISLSAEDMREGLLKREFSSTELVDAHLDYIEQTNSTFNSFIEVCSDIARKQAADADKILKKNGRETNWFTGIPIAIKDQLVTKGITTTCGSRILTGFVPPYECTAVLRLRENGAVFLGKTNQDEFAMGSSGENSAFGATRNPWDTARVPGGSSSGSAAAVSLGQSPISLGTDTGGSIRQPASFTGIYGLKPTYGRVSRYGAVAFASSLDQIGPFSRTIGDIAATLQIIAGFDENDSTSMKISVPDYIGELKKKKGSGIQGLRVGVPKEYFISGIDSAVESQVRNSLKVFEKLGAEIVDISLPHTEHAISVYYIIAPAEASSNLARYDGVRYGFRAPNVQSTTEMYEETRSQGFGPEVKRRILIGTYVLSAGYYDAYYLKAQQVRTLLINDFRAAFANKCDLVATPVTPTTAFKIGEKIDSPLKMYLADVFTIPANLAGLPGISIPCGKDENGLPIGLQLLAPPFEELRLLVAAQAFADECKFDVTEKIKKQ